MHYRTRTYIAGDWTGDAELIGKLYEWNSNSRLNFHFSDAHKMKMARDSSLPCTIKNSLRDRLDGSKTFVLVVGKTTDNLTQGGCQFCPASMSEWRYCGRGHTYDTLSYVKYECEYAAKHKDEMKIVVIYNAATVDKTKCPECIRYTGTHIPAYNKNISGCLTIDYQSIKNMMM